ncbi:MAG TPA: protein phosphatase 2C domain-containing protein [Rhizobacter sp.]|nr:protein phosphatase 2C domain-containing protein [Rhizobacter sp.]
MLQVDIAARCEVGGRNHNEDDLRHGQSGPFWYAVLSDGAGGHKGGAIASDIVVRMTALGLQSATEASPEYLTRLVCEANDTLVQSQDKRGRDRMHATLVALWIDAEHELALWTHVGDSRLYMLRHGRVAHVTQDDSVVQRMVDAGYLTPEEAQHHPSKNQLLSAMGAEDGIEPNTVPAHIEVEDGDAFLLCSDGWWDHFDSRDIETAFAAASSPEEWLDLMADNIRQAALPRQDNYSAIAVWIGDPSETTRLSSLFGETVPGALPGT